MVKTPSTMLALGTQAPGFSLPDVVSGETVSMEDFASKKALLVMFLCRHCPYVKHVEQEIARIGRDYADEDLGIVAISANDIEAYPEDAPDSLKEMALELGFGFPYLYDEGQEVAKAHHAACTPDFYIFDRDRKLAYRGQLDNSRPASDIPVTGEDLRTALYDVLADEPVSFDQKPSLGCNIKWKPGNEPEYFG